MKSVYIIPTGDEIKDGIVLDLDSPEIMRLTTCKYPQAEITRTCPIIDIEDTILDKINVVVSTHPDLVVLIGGSGGGHRFIKTLGKDYTHSALERYLDECSFHEIYGKNGHMWSKLICGKKENTMLINVPGPYIEAKAAFEAFLKAYDEGKSIDAINLDMANAVLSRYGK